MARWIAPLLMAAAGVLVWVVAGPGVLAQVVVVGLALRLAAQVHVLRRQQRGIWSVSPYLTAVPVTVAAFALPDELPGGPGVMALVGVLAGLRLAVEVVIAAAVVGELALAAPAVAAVAAVVLLHIPLLTLTRRLGLNASVPVMRAMGTLAVLLALLLPGARRARTLDEAGSWFLAARDTRVSVALRSWAARICRRRGLAILEAVHLHNAATSSRMGGRNEQALDHLGRARAALAGETGPYAARMSRVVALTEAQARMDLGDLDTALAVIDAALEAGEPDILHADLLSAKAAVAGQIRMDHEEMLALYLESYEVAGRHRDQARMAMRLQDAAAALIRLGRPGEAAALCEEALALLGDGRVRTLTHDGSAGEADGGRLRVMLTVRLAYAVWTQGDRARARRILDGVRDRIDPGSPFYVTLMFMDGLASQDEHDLPAARRAFEAAVEWATRRGGEAAQRITHTYAGRAAERDDPQAAIAHLDRAIALTESGRAGLAAETDRLTFLGHDSRVEAYERMVVIQVAQGDPATAFDYAERGKARAMLDHFAGDDARPIAFGEARELTPGLLVEYFTAEDQVVLIGVRRDRPAMAVSVPLTRAVLRGIATAGFGATGRVGDLDPARWHALDPLVAPIARWAEPGEPVTLIPHGLLHYLPLHALDIEGRPLVERHPVGYAPSASVLRETLRRTADGQGAAVFGDPGGDLPFARAEAKRIAGFLAARPVLRGEVTRDALTGALRRTGIVHFAGHARFVADDPMSSGLVAADGVLTSREVAALGSVTARLVALSGCETGVSRDHPGDDTVGLVRGFLYAGAATVLASLWRVPDHSTAHLITAFYRHLPTGTKAEALRAAMLETRERWPSIYHWAPFVLIGNAE